jgi:hypothetical protein
MALLLRILSLLLFVTPVFADKYVLDGGSSSTCTSWSDACDSLDLAQDVVSRGETIWVGDGTYAGSWLDVATSGTTLITIKKATAAAHGTETGWSSTYGDGQASFGTITPITDYWVFDGATRDESDPPSSWNTTAAYGFAASSITVNTLSGHSACGDHVTIRNVVLAVSPSTCTEGGGWVDCDRPIYLGGFDSGTDGCYDWTISKFKVYASGEGQLAGAELVTIEYGYYTASIGKECFRGQVHAKDITVRYNVFHDCCRPPAEGCTGEVALFRNGGDPDVNEFEGFKAYGNIVWKTGDFSRADYVFSAQAQDCKIYNNTVSDNGDGSGQFACETGGGSDIRNNVTYLTGTQSSGCTADTCSNNSNYTSSPPFTDAANGDFTLTEALVGASLSSPYNEDLTGATRGADGTFDRGAYEFDEGGGEPEAVKIVIFLSGFAALFILGGLLAKSYFNSRRNRANPRAGVVD